MISEVAMGCYKDKKEIVNILSIQGLLFKKIIESNNKFEYMMNVNNLKGYLNNRLTIFNQTEKNVPEELFSGTYRVKSSGGRDYSNKSKKSLLNSLGDRLSVEYNATIEIDKEARKKRENEAPKLEDHRKRVNLPNRATILEKIIKKSNRQREMSNNPIILNISEKSLNLMITDTKYNISNKWPTDYSYELKYEDTMDELRDYCEKNKISLNEQRFVLYTFSKKCNQLLESESKDNFIDLAKEDLKPLMNKLIKDDKDTEKNDDFDNNIDHLSEKTLINKEIKVNEPVLHDKIFMTDKNGKYHSQGSFVDKGTYAALEIGHKDGLTVDEQKIVAYYGRQLYAEFRKAKVNEVRYKIYNYLRSNSFKYDSTKYPDEIKRLNLDGVSNMVDADLIKYLKGTPRKELMKIAQFAVGCEARSMIGDLHVEQYEEYQNKIIK